MVAVDLNSDIGELDGDEGRALDAMILGAVTSCNIACGGHAGDVVSMRATIREAKSQGVRIGAHPSYPDRKNFGRLSLDMPAEELKASLEQQIEALMVIAAEEGAIISHVKPHGALYNDAAKSKALSETICEAVANTGIETLFGPPKGELKIAAVAAGLSYIAEGFVDRSYEPDGSLSPRNLPGSVHEDLERIIEQAVHLGRNGQVEIRSGGVIALSIKTLCLHGDTHGAAEKALRIRHALVDADLNVAPYVG